MSVDPTRHRIDVEVGRRWTWCAIDAVGIVGAIGNGVIQSETNDGMVELHIRQGKITPDLAVFVADGYGMTSSVDEWCAVVNFFPTVEAVSAWMSQSGVQGKAVTVTSIAPEVISRWEAILDHRPA